jgi:hypothetical protein
MAMLPHTVAALLPLQLCYNYNFDTAAAADPTPSSPAANVYCLCYPAAIAVYKTDIFIPLLPLKTLMFIYSELYMKGQATIKQF